MVQFFKHIPLIFLKLSQGDLLIHVEKEFLKNINHKALQPPFCVHPLHHHDLGDVSIHISGCNWNFFNISFGGAWGRLGECLIGNSSLPDQNLNYDMKSNC